MGIQLDPQYIPLIMTIGLVITAIMICSRILPSAGIDSNYNYIGNQDIPFLIVSIALLGLTILGIAKLVPPAILSISNRNSPENLS